MTHDVVVALFSGALFRCPFLNNGGQDSVDGNVGDRGLRAEEGGAGGEVDVQLVEDSSGDVLLVIGERGLQAGDGVEPLLDVGFLCLIEGDLREDLGRGVEVVGVGRIGRDYGGIRPVEKGEKRGIGSCCRRHGVCSWRGWEWKKRKSRRGTDLCQRLDPRGCQSGPQ